MDLMRTLCNIAAFRCSANGYRYFNSLSIVDRFNIYRAANSIVEFISYLNDMGDKIYG